MVYLMIGYQDMSLAIGSVKAMSDYRCKVLIIHEEEITVHAKNKKLDDAVDLKTLAKRTPGFTGADLQNNYIRR